MLAVIVDEGDFSLHHINELIFGRVPVTQGRPAARRQGRQIDAELAQSELVAERSLFARLAILGILRRIAGSQAGLDIARHDDGLSIRHSSAPRPWPRSD